MVALRHAAASGSAGSLPTARPLHPKRLEPAAGLRQDQPGELSLLTGNGRWTVRNGFVIAGPKIGQRVTLQSLRPG